MRAFWEYLHSPRSAINSSLYWSLLCLALLAGCGVIFSIAKELNRRRIKDVYWTRKERVIATVSSIAERASMLILGAILGTFIGMGYRDHQLATHNVTYTDVGVVHKVTDVRYFVQPARMKTMDVTLCSGARVDWAAGDVLEDWTFEQMNGCKRIISYHKKLQGELDASVQIR